MLKSRLRTILTGVAVLLSVLLFLAICLVRTNGATSASDSRLHQPVSHLHSLSLQPLVTSRQQSSVQQWSLNYNTELVKQSLRKKGHSLSNLPPWSALWTDKVHLCIMFNLNRNAPNKTVTDLLVAYYYPFFRNITFIFDGVNWKRPEHVPDFIDVISCDSKSGWYQQKCIRSCIQYGGKDTQGFLYIPDDMFVNLTMMGALNTNKLWFIPLGVKPYSWILNPGPDGYDWHWGPPKNCAKNLIKVIDTLPTQWMNQLRETGGFPDKFKVRAISDIIYIPQTLARNMTLVLDHIIRTADLFCEVATGLAVNIVAPDREDLRYGYLWHEGRTIEGIKKRTRYAHFVHPVKLGIYEPSRIWIELMETQLYSILASSSQNPIHV